MKTGGAGFNREPFDEIECACCGKIIPKNGPRQRVCKEVCKPKEDFKQVCTKCGEEKGYEAYYDFRYNPEGKLLTTCKTCVSKGSLAYYHKRKEAK